MIDKDKTIVVLRVVVYRINIIRPVCNSLVGKHHTFAHRAIAGVLVMAAGVTIAKTLGHHPNEIIAALGDGLGYAVHGMGLIPFVEKAAEAFSD